MITSSVVLQESPLPLTPLLPHTLKKIIQLFIDFLEVLRYWFFWWWSWLRLCLLRLDDLFLLRPTPHFLLRLLEFFLDVFHLPGRRSFELASHELFQRCAEELVYLCAHACECLYLYFPAQSEHHHHADYRQYAHPCYDPPDVERPLNH